MRIVPTLMLLVVSGAIVSCYKPTIGDKLKCNLEAGTNHFCPEGFACEFSTGLCKRRPNNDGPDRPDADGGGGEGGSDADGGPDVICFDPRPNCQPDDTGLCDPLCQTGCRPCEKCSVNTGGTLTCHVLSAGLLPRGLGQNCERFNTGTSTQNDACNPGLVCLAGADDACGGRCYQFCRTEADCNNA